MSRGPGAEPGPQEREERAAWEWEDEGLFTRDLEGRLIRYDAATRAELDYPRDTTSPVIAVDHDACILCDRCVRGCDVIKKNHVIGRMGKGYAARIAFDLERSMGQSSCVACGECADDCPTGALTHREVVATQLPAGRDVGVQDLIAHENPEIRRVFAEMSRPFLEWNIRAIKQRDFRKGEILCNEGSTARRPSSSRTARSRSSSVRRMSTSKTGPNPASGPSWAGSQPGWPRVPRTGHGTTSRSMPRWPCRLTARRQRSRPATSSAR